MQVRGNACSHTKAGKINDKHQLEWSETLPAGCRQRGASVFRRALDGRRSLGSRCVAPSGRIVALSGLMEVPGHRRVPELAQSPNDHFPDSSDGQPECHEVRAEPLDEGRSGSGRVVRPGPRGARAATSEVCIARWWNRGACADNLAGGFAKSERQAHLIGFHGEGTPGFPWRHRAKRATSEVGNGRAARQCGARKQNT